MKRKITVEFKKRDKKDKIVAVKAWITTYFQCPHCKRIIFGGEPEPMGQLREMIKGYQKEFRKKNRQKKKK